jgi:hypothetical protein
MALTVTENGRVIQVTGTTAVSQVVSASNVKITKIIWNAPTADGHKLSMTDVDGNTIFLNEADTNFLGTNLSEDFPHPGIISNGIYIDDMDSGTVLIYLG